MTQVLTRHPVACGRVGLGGTDFTGGELCAKPREGVTRRLAIDALSAGAQRFDFGRQRHERTPTSAASVLSSPSTCRILAREASRGATIGRR